jgi:hypothetical protein
VKTSKARSFSNERHWDEAYKGSKTKELGWYEEEARPSLQLIEKINLSRTDRMFHAGAGKSTLIASLLELGYRNIIVNDISRLAIESMQRELIAYDSKVAYLHKDLTNPSEFSGINEVALWHDRAVLHFFTENRQQKKYFDLLRKLVADNGFVILAQFNRNGAKMCSGLPVKNYDAPQLSEALGKDFELLEEFDYIYTQPRGDKRPYIYTLFKRIRKKE